MVSKKTSCIEEERCKQDFEPFFRVRLALTVSRGRQEPLLRFSTRDHKLECPMIGADLAAKYEDRNESGFPRF